MGKVSEIFLTILVLLMLHSCGLFTDDVSNLIENNHLRWGMDSTSFNKLMTNDHSLSFYRKEELNSNTSYVYLGGVLKNISLKGIKFLFKDNSLEGMEIWIDSPSKHEMDGKYTVLAKYFNSIGKLEFNASNDAWVYIKNKEANENHPDTDIFLVPDGNKILIHIHKSYVAKESIFIN